MNTNITGTLTAGEEVIPFTNEDYLAVKNKVAFVKQLLLQLSPVQLKLLAYANDDEAQFSLHINSVHEDDYYDITYPLDIGVPYLHWQ